MEFEPRYYAGFFDGEGSVGIYFRNQNKLKTRKYAVLIVCIAQTGELGKRILQPLQDRFGGCITKSKQSGRDMWKWYISSNKAHSFLSEILPFTFIKRGQIELALQFQQTSDKVESNQTVVELASSIKQLKHAA